MNIPFPFKTFLHSHFPFTPSPINNKRYTTKRKCMCVCVCVWQLSKPFAGRDVGVKWEEGWRGGRVVVVRWNVKGKREGGMCDPETLKPRTTNLPHTHAHNTHTVCLCGGCHPSPLPYFLSTTIYLWH